MAWRIDEQVARGEIDCRVRGRVSGRIWLAGRGEPLALELAGNPWRDLAGRVLRFTNPQPKEGGIEGLASEQHGSVGDITASRRVRVPGCPPGEMKRLRGAGEPCPWRWANALYLEWFGTRNGRVVIESSDYQLEFSAEAAWELTPDEEAAQQAANREALAGFMERIAGPAQAADGPPARPSVWDEEDDDAPHSRLEAEADAEAARMDLLLDRMTARLEREGHEDGKFEQIMEEERARLRRERGEPEEPEPTPEEEAERAAWIEELNASAEEALADLESEAWKGDPFERERHPLVERCSDFAVKLHKEVEHAGWLPREQWHREHPLAEIVDGVMIASAKLAGALGSAGDREWPPPALFAGDTLVRLKKARAALRDALGGLEAATEQHLATAAWRAATLRETTAIRAEVEDLITEVRTVLKRASDGQEWQD